MQRNNTEICILIKGKPIAEYAHNGDLFVEGREGSEFEIEITNRNDFEVEAVVSVDGLSITDGKEAGENSSGYLVEAQSTIRVPGWKLSNEQVAAFFFSGKKQSYAALTTGSSRNNGVIGAMVFASRHQRRWKSHEITDRGMTMSGRRSGGILRGNNSGAGGMVWGSSSGVQNGMFDPTFSDNISWSSSTSMSSGAAGASTSYGVGAAPASAPYDGAMLSGNIGTGFGHAQDYATENVAFERGDMLAVMYLYYDDARGLRARGIDVSRRTVRQVAKPQAFPAMNCAPPKGWNG